MGETILSTIVGVILPHGLIPDTYPVVYDEDGLPAMESLDHCEPDEEIEEDWAKYCRYTAIALKSYNESNGTDYRLCEGKGTPHSTFETYHINGVKFFHSGFYAFSSSDVSAVAKTFCFDFENETGKFVSCHKLEGIGCKFCRIPKSAMVKVYCPTPPPEKLARTYIPPPYLYSGCLAEGVNLSDKAKLRLEFALPALEYYNNKQHTAYKLVDALPNCISFDISFVTHLNLIARQEVGGDASNELFFAELELRNKEWVVVACLVVRGKTTAGCLQCPCSLRARQVIHPTHGFHHGIDPSLATTTAGLKRPSLAPTAGLKRRLLL